MGGMGRSGTSLLRNLLDSHPAIASGPEFFPLQPLLRLFGDVKAKIHNKEVVHYIDYETLQTLTKSGIDRVLGGYARRKSKEVLVEKSPSNLWFFPALADLYPDAKFIQIIRDGRDVVCSHLEVGRRHAKMGKSLDPVNGIMLVSALDGAILWNTAIEHGESLCGSGSRLHAERRCITVKYEDLVFRTEAELRRICTFLEVPFDPGMLFPERAKHDDVIDGLWVTEREVSRPVSVASVGRWREEMTLAQRICFSAAAHNTLASLGYEKSTGWALEGLSLDSPTTAEEMARARDEIAKHPLLKRIKSTHE